MRALVIVVSALGLLGGPQAQQPAFRASAEAVRVDVSVRDRARVIANLGAADFEVLDNGVPQQIDEASFGKLPIDVTVALDVSLSVTGTLLTRLGQAVRQLMRDLSNDDRLKLITFNMRVTRIVDFTTDAGLVEQAIQSARGSGGSSILDAVTVGLVSASQADRRQLVVVFTDGVDTSSTTEPDTLADLAQRTNASVTAVVPASIGSLSLARGGFGGMMRVVPSGLSSAWLRRLTVDTGGVFIPALSGDLTAIFRRALDEFRSSYVLHYTPRGVERGGFHTLEVKVKGRSSLTVRARRGYFGS